jgi:acyl carrier protein
MKKRILEILTEIRPEFDFATSDDYIADGMLDSFDIVNLVTILDKEYGVSIDGMDILPQNFSSAVRIAKLLLKNGVVG